MKIRTVKKAPFYSLYRDGVTQSMLSALLECPAKCSLSYRRGLASPRLSGAICYGNCVHGMLESIYNKAEGIHTVEQALELVDTKLSSDMLLIGGMLTQQDITSPENEQETQLILAQLAAVMPEYIKYWGEKDFGAIEWELIEWVFNAQWLGENGKPIPITGKFDGTFRVGGKPWLLETKTKSQVDEDLITDELTLDLQVMLYAWAYWQIHGDFPAGVLYNIIRRPALRIKKGESFQEFASRMVADVKERPDFYFTRFEVALHKQDILAWEEEFSLIMRQVQTWDRGELNYRVSRACSGKYGKCGFLPMCSRGEQGHLIRKPCPFPELITDNKGVE